MERLQHGRTRRRARWHWHLAAWHDGIFHLDSKEGYEKASPRDSARSDAEDEINPRLSEHFRCGWTIGELKMSDSLRAVDPFIGRRMAGVPRVRLEKRAEAQANTRAFSNPRHCGHGFEAETDGS